MKYFLDTNICIYALKNNPPQIVQRLKSIRPRDVGISVITVAELRMGASNSQHPIKNHRVLDNFLWPFCVEPFSVEAAEYYGKIASHLRKKGKPIGPFDCLIAAHALALGVTVVTNNMREFRRVPKLSCENWL